MPAARTAAAAAAVAAAARGAIVRRELDYDLGGDAYEGYVAYDDTAAAPLPAAMVVHQYAGIGRNERERCEQLAEWGYYAFAVDMYGKGIRPTTQQDAAGNATLLRSNPPLLRERAMKGLEVLGAQPGADAARAVCSGYCFGGTVCLELARTLAPLKAVASFHGNLDPLEPLPGNLVEAAVTVHHPTGDGLPMLSRFNDEMDERRTAVWDTHLYGNTVHGFALAHPAIAGHSSYDPRAGEAAHEYMRGFFADVLAGKKRAAPQ